MKNDPPYIACFERMACQQTVYAMILEHFTKVVQTKEDMDALCDAEKGKWTWQFSPMKNLCDLGYDVAYVSNFNTKDFAEKPEEYLTELEGSELAKLSFEKSSDISLLQSQAKKAADYIKDGKILWENKVPDISDINRYLNNGYLLCHWIDSSKISGANKNRGHFVLVYENDIKENNIIFHNPGGYTEDGSARNQCLGQTLSHDFFLECAFPSNESGGFIAIKPVAKTSLFL